MYSNSSAGNEDEIVGKLDNIDQWLNQIVDVKAAPLNFPKAVSPTPQPPKPQHPAHAPQGSSPKPQQHPNKPHFTKEKPMQNTFNPNSNPKPRHPGGGRRHPGGHPGGPRGGNRPPQHGGRPPQPQPGRPGAQPAPYVPSKAITKGKLRIIPLGGFEEVGKNMMLFEYENDIIIVDMGFQFPTEDMLGVDYVLPDITYLLERKNKIRGVFLTHGHLDHIGAIPYLLPKLGFPPVYGAALTIGFVEKQLVEFELHKVAKLITFDPSERIRAGVFDISFFRVNHSIPDAVAIVIDTPAGRIVHTGDFKFDFSPADQRPADLQEIALVGKQGVAVLISDSTNSLEPGHTTSEKVIAANLDEIIRQAKGRLIITSFSSLIGRLQQIMDSSIKYKRRIFLTGRSMEANIRIAQQLGYVKVPKGVIGDIRKLNQSRDDQTIILTTGSQGEDVSALARMATDNHAKVKLQPGDTVVLSASPIPGNETSVTKVINGLCRLGAKVVTNKEINIHTSGHAKQEDLKLMLKLLNPKYLIPEHGDLYMRTAHKEIGIEFGIPAANIFLMDNGDVAEGDNNLAYAHTKEKVPAGYVMVEGPERSEVGNHILTDRQLMSENGAIAVVFHADKSNYALKNKPTIESRGFVYTDLSNKVADELMAAGKTAFEQFVQSHKGNVHKEELEDFIQHSLDRLMVRRLDKRPLILPVIVFN